MKDLHMHTVFSDGKNTPEEMVEEAIRLGLDTVGISDHSHLDPCGMTLEAGAEYRAELARLKKKYSDVLQDGDELKIVIRAIDQRAYDYLYSMQQMSSTGTNPIDNFTGGFLFCDLQSI